jgi:hypothetical protein
MERNQALEHTAMKAGAIDDALSERCEGHECFHTTFIIIYTAVAMVSTGTLLEYQPELRMMSDIQLLETWWG